MNHRILKNICLPYFLLLANLLFGIGAPAYAQMRIDLNSDDASQSYPAESSIVSLDLNQASFSDAVKALFSQVDVPYQIVPSYYVENTRITLHLKKVSFLTALSRLMRAHVGLKEDAYTSMHTWELRRTIEYRIKDGVYVFEEGEGVLNDPVTLTLKNADRASAIQRLCDRAEVSYAFTLDGCISKKIFLTLKNVPFDQALRKIVKTAASSLRLNAQIRQGVVSLWPVPDRVIDAERETLTLRETVRFHDEDLYYALRAALDVLGINHTITEAAKECTLSASFSEHDKTVQQVMDRLLRLDGKLLGYVIENHAVVWQGPERPHGW